MNEQDFITISIMLLGIMLLGLFNYYKDNIDRAFFRLISKKSVEIENKILVEEIENKNNQLKAYQEVNEDLKNQINELESIKLKYRTLELYVEDPDRLERLINMAEKHEKRKKEDTKMREVVSPAPKTLEECINEIKNKDRSSSLINHPQFSFLGANLNGLFGIPSASSYSAANQAMISQQQDQDLSMLAQRGRL